MKKSTILSITLGALLLMASIPTEGKATQSEQRAHIFEHGYSQKRLQELESIYVSALDEINWVLRNYPSTKTARTVPKLGIHNALQQYCPQLSRNARVIQFYQNNPKIGISAEQFAREMQKKLVEEKRNPENQAARIQHVTRTLEFMQTLYPGSKYQAQNYKGALKQRDAVYRYCMQKGIKILSDNEFLKVVTSLKKKLGKREDEPLGDGLYFDTAIVIITLEEGMEADKKQALEYFNDKQSALRVKCSRLDEPYYLTFDGARHNLSEEWQRVAEEIDSIAQSKKRDPLQLNFAKLTYDDHYAAFFDREYDAMSVEEGVALQNRLLGLIRTHMKDDSQGFVKHERRVTYGQDGETRIYFQDPDGEITGQRGTLYSLPKNADATRVYFISKIKEYFSVLNEDKGDKGFFRARAKILLDMASSCLIPDKVARPGSCGFNSAQWEKALNEAQYKMALRIIASLEGCDTGKDRKLGNIEKDYRNILGLLIPHIPLVKSIASIVRGIKLKRIAETGLNPDPHRIEERETIPQVLTQRLRGPLGLLGSYMPITGSLYGYPNAPQNAPIQIIRNLFVEGQPARSYYKGPVPQLLLGFLLECLLETSLPIYLPIAPCLTVKRLVEKVYGKFGKSITGNDIHQFLKGHLDLIQEQIDVDVYYTLDQGVFYKRLPHNVHKPKPQDQFTREMAFYILEKMGYVTIGTEIKNYVYKVDKNGQPGTILFRGEQKTLADLIDIY